MDRHTPGVWCVLALLVVSAAVSRAVNTITLASMTWSTSGGDQTLTVCAADVLTTGIDKAHLNVRSTNGTFFTQKNFDGAPGDPDPTKCAVFTVTATLPVPDIEERTYELTTYTSDALNDRGKVTFAFPLSQGTKIECGSSSQFTRFSVVDGGGSALSGSACITDSDSSVCYITGGSNPVCVTGLDQSLETPDAFEVCVPNSGIPIPVTEDLISAVSLTYDEDRIGGLFTISSDTETNPIELLSVIQDSLSEPSVTTCDVNLCTFDSGDPSTKVYDLCSVYVDTSGSVTNVGTYEFQDLLLTVDEVGDTVDFRFANLNSEDDCNYYVFESDGTSTPPTIDQPSFTLDCSHIDSNSFCNGFFDGSTLPTHIGVSFISKNNVVVAPVPIPTTTTTQASVPLSKIKENAMDLTNQNTEGIVPSSA